jgi:DNA-binding GntR family transcriptional regulator
VSVLYTEAYNTLLNRLLRNELIPGMFLNRQELAAELGFSVAPVREAMKQLERDGFLISIPRKGTQVRPLDLEEMRGQLLVREALECQAARIYCGEAVAENEEHLISSAGVLDSTPAFTFEHWRVDLSFHEALVALTGVPALIRECGRVMRLNIFHFLNLYVDYSDRRGVRGHRELVQDLRTSDPDLAEKAMRNHIRAGKPTLPST